MYQMMLLNPPFPPSLPHSQLISHPSSPCLSNFLPFPSGFLCNSPLKRTQFNPSIIVCSSSSMAAKFSGLEDTRGEKATWKMLYKRLWKAVGPEQSCTDVLDEWEQGGQPATRWQLIRIVKELRKFGNHKLALEVYEWMNDKPERFVTTSSSDAAIQLDLISKVHGIPKAEEYFNNLPNDLRDKRVYGALLNAYVRSRKKEKAESLLAEMKEKNYATIALPYNVIMTLYLKLKDYQKVDTVVSEMMRDRVALDQYSYNIWLTSHGYRGDIENMEQVFEQLKLDQSVNPSWNTYSSMATMYAKFGEIEKAEECLRTIERETSGFERDPFHDLLRHYGAIGNKGEVKRIWEVYKTNFRMIPNKGYVSGISAFLLTDDVETAEQLYKEWLLVKLDYEPKIGNLFLESYAKNGLSEKFESFLKEMLEIGKPDARTWEIVAESRIKQRKLSDALSCFEKAASAVRWRSWRPIPSNVLSLYQLCEQEKNEAGKEALLGVLRHLGLLDNGAYTSSLPFLKASNSGKKSSADIQENQDDDNEGAHPVLQELQADF